MSSKTSERKTDHLDFAIKSQESSLNVDNRFMYEPMLGNISDVDLSMNFLDTVFEAPIWISSMTGGTDKAAIINKNLAKVCSQFGLGMGLGSCRQLLDDNTHLEDFKIRKYINNRPLYANLGIAQIEQLIKSNKTEKINELLKKLEVDGLIVHVNPIQEFTQPEGDLLLERPIDTIKKLIEKTNFKIIVKEVGQGMGYESIKELLKLPIEAVDFAAFGGTNFAKLELLRNTSKSNHQYNAFINIGHTADEMVEFVNNIKEDTEVEKKCTQIIISGGIKSFLDGYYYKEKISLPSIYGMASEFLKYANGEYEALEEYVSKHIEGLRMAKAYLKIKKN